MYISYSICRMDDCINALGDAASFSLLDASSGNCQVEVKEWKQEKCGCVPSGAVQVQSYFIWIEQGARLITGAMDVIMQMVQWQFVLVLLEDIVIFSKTLEAHVKQSR